MVKNKGMVGVKLDPVHDTDSMGFIGRPALDRIAETTRAKLGWPDPNTSFEVKRLLTYGAANMPPEFMLDAALPNEKLPDTALLEAAEAGLTLAETAGRYGVSTRTVTKRWRSFSQRHGVVGHFGKETAGRVRDAISRGY